MAIGRNEEIEADYFATCLLMPEKLVRDYLCQRKNDMTEDDDLKAFASTFRVPLLIAARRLESLGFGLGKPDYRKTRSIGTHIHSDVRRKDAH